jgi:competence protein ComEA
MATADERRALAFLVTLALVAGGVRYVGVQRFEREVRAAAGGSPRPDLSARALAAQIAAVDSAQQAPKKRKTRVRSASLSRKPAAPTLAANDAPLPQRVDVNAATAEELERLPRVGPALASRIVAWRLRNGPFRQSEDLRHVRGIGPSTVRLLDTLVTFSGRPRP